MANHCEAVERDARSYFPIGVSPSRRARGIGARGTVLTALQQFPQLISHLVYGGQRTNLKADGHLERAAGPWVGFVCHGVQEPFVTEQ